jgi:glycosyltransferase involved in cell wall biosynthesis
MLVKLVAELHGRSSAFAVVSLLDSGTQGAQLNSLGVPVAELRMKEPLALPALPMRLRDAVRRFRPDVIQGWMYHGNLAATIGRRLATSPARLFWGVRQTFYGMEKERRLTRLAIRANAAFSGSAERVIFNSTLSMQQHIAAGFSAERCMVIPNGFETDLFRPDPAARADTRRRMGIPESGEVVGLVARDHPMKDHANFLRAAAQVAKARPLAWFVLAGTGVDSENRQFARLIAEAGVGERTRLLGEVRDTHRLFPALDVAVLSSAWGEAFPNVLGEALACGVPCVSTDVGDAHDIVGEAGRVVAVGDSDQLAAAIVEVLGLGGESRRALGETGRRRVEGLFSIRAVAEQYLSLYTMAARRTTSDVPR